VATQGRDFLRTLGGVIRFIEVSRDPNSTPRDRLLAKRTWQHRKLLTYSDYSAGALDTDEPVAFDYSQVDEYVMVLNSLRLDDPPKIDSIEVAYDMIVDLIVRSSRS
jgi:hypothetical protein